jgi:hypothetical protein
MVKSLFAFLLILVLPAWADDAATNAAPATTNAPTVATTPADASGKTLAISNDTGFGNDGAAKDTDSYQVRIGELYAPGGECYIVPIRLPAIPDGQQIVKAHIRAQLLAINNEGNGLANADLYSLGVRDTNKAVAGDYFQGTKDGKATLLQAKFLTPASPVRADADKGPFVETSADGDAALAKAVTDACAKPENAGKFLFLRVSYALDPIPTGNNAYMLLTTGAGGDNEPPLITYTLGKK